MNISDAVQNLWCDVVYLIQRVILNCLLRRMYFRLSLASGLCPAKGYIVFVVASDLAFVSCLLLVYIVLQYQVYTNFNNDDRIYKGFRKKTWNQNALTYF